MSRPYTGTTEGVDRGRRPGLEALVHGIEERTGGRVWVNGTYQVRPKRSVGGRSKGLSVHATGRAADLSRRNHGGHPGSDRAYLETIINLLVDNADDIGLEMLLDYQPAPHGRGWKCTREAWEDYTRPTIGSGGQAWADWIHIELDPEHADSTDWVPAFLDKISAAPAPAPAPPAYTIPSSAPAYPGQSTRRGSRATARVKMIQAQLAALGLPVGPVDGKFGPMTDRAVRAFQEDENLTVDGIVGPATWRRLFG